MKILYAKCNSHRRPPFRIVTTIVEADGRYVEKRALTAEACGHIHSIRQGYERLQEGLIDEGFKLPAILEAGDAFVRFAFIEGRSLDELLLQAVLEGDRPAFMDLIDVYHTRLRRSFRTIDYFLPAGEAAPIFRDIPTALLDKEGPFSYYSFLDPIFENIVVQGDDWYIIDNEWVFDGCLPVSFPFFRSLLIFYKVKYGPLGVDALIPFEELLNRYGIPEKLQKVYYLIEANFQRYVNGLEQEVTRYKRPYRKKRESIVDLIRVQNRFAQLYIDTGLGSNEQQSIVCPLTGDDRVITFDLRGYGDIRAVRFDPINDHVALHLHEVSVLAAGQCRHVITNYETNALYQDGNNLVFHTPDPQIRIDMSCIDEPQLLSVRLDYVAVGLAAVFDYVLAWAERRLACNREELVLCKEELSAREVELQMKSSALEHVKTLLSQREKIIDEIYLSRSWHVTKPLRLIKEFLHGGVKKSS
jgi:hypothetical protein